MSESLSNPKGIKTGFVPMSSGAVVRECAQLGASVGGGVGEIVERIQRLILHYYDDVREQAEKGFRAARNTAVAGFVVLVLTIGYVLVIDWAVRAGKLKNETTTSAMTIGQIGLIAGTIVELLAGTQFVLQGRTAKQFGAFHICLERTHRYLLAYKIAETMTENRDHTLEKIVCTMASAPMITRQDIDDVGSNHPTANAKSPAQSMLAET
jgi:hypothetical protein